MIGKHDDARAAFESALAHIPPESAPRTAAIPRGRLHRKVSATFEMSHRHADALAACDRASDALAPLLPVPGAALDREALHEWLWVQIERIGAHYWLADVAAIREHVDAVTPWMSRVDDPELEAAFFHVLTQWGLRHERYLVSDDTVAHARAALDRTEAQHGLALSTAERRFTLGYVLLFHGEHAEATALLEQAMSEGERLGFAQLFLRCRTYAAVARRRAGDDRAVVSLAEPALLMARDLGAQDYEAVAEANLAWVASRAFDRKQALARATRALSLWQSGNYMFPHQWLARCPLLALTDPDEYSQIRTHAEALLAPSQMRWPPPTEQLLQTALATGVLATTPETASARDSLLGA
ncbi:MAG: hypothetical protein R3B70_17770 [Polyangiaceae bacterium]